MIKFILDAMYYQIFIFNRDKFILENPHERTIQIICGILFLPVIVLAYLLIEENFNYKTPFVFFIIIYVLLYKTFCSYYIKRKKGMEIVRSKPLIFNSQKVSSFISWMIYPILVVLLYFIITHRHWLKIIQQRFNKLVTTKDSIVRCYFLTIINKVETN